MAGPTIVEISTQLDKALKDMSNSKQELEKAQEAVAAASNKHQDSVNNVHQLKAELDRTLSEAMGNPIQGNIGRVRMA